MKLKVKVVQSCLTLCNSMDLIVPGILQARILEWVAFPFSRRCSQPRDQIQVSTLQVDSLSAEPQGKPKNTGVGSLSILQQIFPTQELKQGLLHCRQMLYQLSFEENHVNLRYLCKFRFVLCIRTIKLLHHVIQKRKKDKKGFRAIIQKETCNPVFIAVLLTIDRTQAT